MRKRIYYIILVMIIIVLGLLSRKYSNIFPLYIGDILWATMVYFIFKCILIKGKIRKILTYTLIFSYSIEFSQLLRYEWLQNLRQIKLIGLVIGYDFVISDLLYYTIGAILAVFVDNFLMKNGIKSAM